MQKILVLDSQIKEYHSFIESKSKNLQELCEYINRIKENQLDSPLKNIKIKREKFADFFKENAQIIFTVSQLISKDNDFYYHYQELQNGCCPICGGVLCSNSQFLFFNTIHDVLIYKTSFMDRSSAENVSIPLFDPCAQFLICPSCFRASRNHIAFLNKKMNSGKKSIAWYNPYDIITIPFFVSGEGIVFSNLMKFTTDSVATNNNMNHNANILQFNLNNKLLIENRKHKFIKTISQIKEIFESNDVDSNIAMAYEILSPKNPHSLARYSAVWSFFDLPPFGENSEEKNKYFMLTNAAFYLDIAPRLENACPSSMESVKENIRECINEFSDTKEKSGASGYEDLCNSFINIFIQEIKRTKHLKKSCAAKISPANRVSACPPRFIRKFEITNYRGFSTDKAIDLDAEKGEEVEAAALPPLPNAAFLADNAGGKTRILQALAWALMGRTDVEFLLNSELNFPPYLLPSYTTSDSEEKTTIKIWFFDRPENEHLEVVFPAKFGPKRRGYRRSLTTGRGRKKAYEDRIPFLPFGSNRSPSLLRGGTVSDILSPCLHSLFFRDKHVPHPLSLVGFSELLELGKSHGEIVVRTLLNVLLDCGGYGKKAPGVTVKNENGTVAFFYGGNEFDCLSEGLQAVATLAIYILLGLKAKMETAATGCSEDFTSSMAGIVLMDELDAHLHPRWRRQILRQLRAVFPNVQFLFTTHDPVVLRGMPARNVLRIEPPTDQSGKCGVHRLSETGLLAGYEIDDLLISMLFNLDSTRDDHDRDGYREYFQLSVEYANEKLTNPDKENKFLSDRLDHLREIYGAERLGLRHPTDRLLLPALDLLLGEEINTKSLQSSPADSSSPESAPSSPAEDIKNILVQLWSL